MNPQELSAYITALLRSDAEIITAFIMGAIFTGMIVFAFRCFLVKRCVKCHKVTYLRKENSELRKEVKRLGVESAVVQDNLKTQVSLAKEKTKQAQAERDWARKWMKEFETQLAEGTEKKQQ